MIGRILLMLLLVAGVALAGCGKKGKLEPPDDAPQRQTPMGR